MKRRILSIATLLIILILAFTACSITVTVPGGSVPDGAQPKESTAADGAKETTEPAQKTTKPAEETTEAAKETTKPAETTKPVEETTMPIETTNVKEPQPTETFPIPSIDIFNVDWDEVKKLPFEEKAGYVALFFQMGWNEEEFGMTYEFARGDDGSGNESMDIILKAVKGHEMDETLQAMATQFKKDSALSGELKDQWEIFVDSLMEGSQDMSEDLDLPVQILAHDSDGELILHVLSGSVVHNAFSAK